MTADASSDTEQSETEVLEQGMMVFDVAELPENEKTKRCQCWTGHEPSQCENTAGYVFVFNRNAATDGYSVESLAPIRLGNALACQSCTPEVNQ